MTKSWDDNSEVVEDSALLPGLLSDSVTGFEEASCSAVRQPIPWQRGPWQRGPRGGEDYTEDRFHGGDGTWPGTVGNPSALRASRKPGPSLSPALCKAAVSVLARARFSSEPQLAVDLL